MDIHDIRQQLRTKSIYDIPLRVTYYARVSSESDEQLNSLGNQIQYYEDFIRRNAAWTFVPGYIDEGLSGISTKHRENFNRMVEDAAEDKFDLIITKEISVLPATRWTLSSSRGSSLATAWACSSRTTISTPSMRTPNCGCPSCLLLPRTSCASLVAA